MLRSRFVTANVSVPSGTTVVVGAPNAGVVERWTARPVTAEAPLPLSWFVQSTVTVRRPTPATTAPLVSVAAFWGFYANDEWTPTPRLTVTAGARYDLTEETLSASFQETGTPAPETSKVRRSDGKLSGGVSALFRIVTAPRGILDEANVYGVAIPGQDGRAGMAALVVNERFDLERVGKAIHDGLAPYARPLFLRILPQMEITGTFKHRKVDLVRDGFDPGRIPDALYFRDPALGRYVPLDATLFEAIRSGQTRL